MPSTRPHSRNEGVLVRNTSRVPDFHDVLSVPLGDIETSIEKCMDVSFLFDHFFLIMPLIVG